tara:strand:- start:1006 stop:1566 length:561 start_codon:yes stop_codon:yes gene_type:complete
MTRKIPMSHSTLLPGSKAPVLQLSTLAAPSWDLHEQSPETFTMIVFYRGLHCPKCKQQLEELQSYYARFEEIGVSIIAVSMDSEERAQRTRNEWDIPNINIGYGLSQDTAEQWGLFLSERVEKKPPALTEPLLFSEPSLFLIQADGTIYSASIQTMPFARPHCADILNAINFIKDKNYPARGTFKA